MSTVQVSLVVIDSPLTITRITRLLQSYKFTPFTQDFTKASNPKHKNLVLLADGNGSIKELAKRLASLSGIVSVLGIVPYDANSQTATSPTNNDSLNKSNKEVCRAILDNIFGEGSGDAVDDMPENECVELCRARVMGLAGPDAAKVFDKLT